ncbi:BZ3500_MvSof-1268-A1-R1_Chr1-3g02524 [Microbotryum saponariae]|uniref:BZ3500_MvSof-1268-A1-R1_Chr1-3g02524 protein n=1 Tax=Microbotryum saponariae TaxID=289078 RepID=A0A2X0MQ77_9BASI|nr:BZ3500_MvSof-1268-A1-R1_Chr1-3g02524 [Microbotryum saponariae]SCZ96480.1 BZ3501_MvSof-1269-A2-R1_Chr1-3g02127 [Microbotryum saponariae]
MSDPLFSVDSKIALVTGGGTGIGRMVATALAQRGAKVYIVGRREEKLQEVVKETASYMGSIVALPGDVSNKDGILKVVETFKTKEKSLNILVNAAGILRMDPVKADPDDSKFFAPYRNLAEALLSAPWVDWQDSMGMNVSALYFLSVGFAPLLHQAYLDSPSSEDAPKETPVVINIGSIAGIHNASCTPGDHQRDAASVSYQTSKSAVIHLTKCLASRFLPLRIRVNCIAPGLFPSEMTNSDPKEIRNTHKTHFKAMPEGGKLSVKITSCRAGAPEDIAGPVLLLASRAGAYMNGNTLDVSGGRTLLLSASIIPDA